MFKKYLIIFLTVILGFNSYSSFAQENIGRHSVARILIDGNGKILLEDNANLIYPIASLTKLMTALIIIEKLEKNEIKEDTYIKISKKAAALGGRNNVFRKGEKVKLGDLLKTAILKSSNVSAYALAEYVGKGNVQNFVKMMNERAQQLGLYSTIFYTPHGLPLDINKLDVSTAYDLAKLCQIILKHQKYLDISSKSYVKIKKNKLGIFNTNKLVNIYDGVDGLKTGFHLKSQYNIAVSALKDNTRLIAVILGAPSEEYRINEAKKLLDFGFNIKLNTEKKFIDNSLE